MALFQTQLQLWLKARTNFGIYFPMKPHHTQHMCEAEVVFSWLFSSFSCLRNPLLNSVVVGLFNILCSPLCAVWNSKHTLVHFTKGQNRKNHSVYANSHFRHFPLSVRTPTSTNYCLQKHGEGEFNSVLA